MSCKDVLIVEDDKDVREGFAYLLEEEGFEVHQAENGFRALEFLKARKHETPGCIILDLIMPIMDGRTFLETLNKEHPDDLCKIPIILATAMKSIDQSLGELPCMTEVISKPIDIDDLVATVHRHCRPG